MQAWADSRENFKFIPVVEHPTDSWTGSLQKNNKRIHMALPFLPAG